MKIKITDLARGKELPEDQKRTLRPKPKKRAVKKTVPKVKKVVAKETKPATIRAKIVTKVKKVITKKKKHEKKNRSENL